MAWYGKNAGTVSVTNGSTAVIGTGTAFIANCKVGDEFKLEGGMRGYEIIARSSDTVLTIDPPYLDASESGKAYRIVPTRGGPVSAAFETVQSILSQWNTYLSGVLSGLFPAGTAGSPSIARQGDTNTGFYWPAADQIAAATNGIRRWLLSATAMQVDVPITGTAVQQSKMDVTAGRLLTAGAYGWGIPAPEVLDDMDRHDLSNAVYKVDNNVTVGTFPAEVSSSAVLLVMRPAYNQTTQMYCTPNGGGVYIRSSYSTTSWGPWRRLDAVYGSGPNGAYARYPDGTLICWGAVVTSASAEAPVVFPAAFASTTNLRVSLGVYSGAPSSLAPRITARTTTGMSVSCFYSTDTRVATNVEYIAIGRWI
ncbi:MAG: pyocin knob domain-containing protein [Pseudodonghicola sp.]